MSVNVQGFTANAVVREYRRESSIDSHEITFTILNEAFTSGRLSLQNGPDICSLKLHRELADSSSNPLKTHYRTLEEVGQVFAVISRTHSPNRSQGAAKATASVTLEQVPGFS